MTHRTCPRHGLLSDTQVRNAWLQHNHPAQHTITYSQADDGTLHANDRYRCPQHSNSHMDPVTLTLLQAAHHPAGMCLVEHTTGDQDLDWQLQQIQKTAGTTHAITTQLHNHNKDGPTHVWWQQLAEMNRECRAALDRSRMPTAARDLWTTTHQTVQTAIDRQRQQDRLRTQPDRRFRRQLADSLAGQVRQVSASGRTRMVNRTADDILDDHTSKPDVLLWISPNTARTMMLPKRNQRTAAHQVPLRYPTVDTQHGGHLMLLPAVVATWMQQQMQPQRSRRNDHTVHITDATQLPANCRSHHDSLMELLQVTAIAHNRSQTTNPAAIRNQWQQALQAAAAALT